jgi:hypothetical protein
VSAAVKPLGHLLCDSCGVERDGAPDRADWTFTVAGGALREVVCPTCAGADGNRPSRELYPVPGSAAAGPVELEISDHAVERYWQRVRPTLTLEAAEEDLARQLEAHGYWAQPDWLSEKELGDDRWLMLGDSIGFAVRGDRVVSCFVRGTFNPRGRRLATEANGWARRVRRARENPAKRKWEGRQAKRSRKRDRSWRDEERGMAG